MNLATVDADLNIRCSISSACTLIHIKFTYSEKAKTFCKLSNIDLTVTTYNKSTEEIFGLLRMYEL